MHTAIDSIIYKERIYTSQRLRLRLAEEIGSLKNKLRSLEGDATIEEFPMAQQYRDMIRQRERLYVALD